MKTDFFRKSARPLQPTNIVNVPLKKKDKTSETVNSILIFTPVSASKSVSKKVRPGPPQVYQRSSQAKTGLIGAISQVSGLETQKRVKQVAGTHIPVATPEAKKPAIEKKDWLALAQQALADLSSDQQASKKPWEGKAQQVFRDGARLVGIWHEGELKDGAFLSATGEVMYYVLGFDKIGEEDIQLIYPAIHQLAAEFVYEEKDWPALAQQALADLSSDQQESKRPWEGRGQQVFRGGARLVGIWHEGELKDGAFLSARSEVMYYVLGFDKIGEEDIQLIYPSIPKLVSEFVFSHGDLARAVLK